MFPAPPDALRAAGRWALDLLLPPSCLTCDEPVGAPGQLCAACFRATAFVAEPCCDRCGRPFAAAAVGGADRTCDRCRADPPPWSRARAAMLYDRQAQSIVLALKRGDRVEIARALAPHLARAGAALLRDAEVLVPVPLHRWRLVSRRYNQSALLARALARRTGLAASLDALRRVRRTEILAGKSAAARAAEVAGAFAVRQPERVAGRRVLLVDDVLTSGATAGACARALLGAGAAAVDLLVAARVPDPRSSG